MKLKAMQARIDEQYEKLGELVYRELHVEESLEEEKLEIIAVIDALFDELFLLKAEDAEKAAADAAKEPSSDEADGED